MGRFAKPGFLHRFLFFPSSVFSLFFLILNQGFDPPGWPFSLLAVTIWTTLTKALALDFPSQMAHIQQKHLIPLAYRRYPYIIPHNTGRSSSLIIISFVLIDRFISFSFLVVPCRAFWISSDGILWYHSNSTLLHNFLRWILFRILSCTIFIF